MIASVNEIALESIELRPDGDTRMINFDHVFEIALSIHEVGLIEPIVVDRHHSLIAGAHRLWALKLLNMQTRGQTINRFKAMARHMGGLDGYKKIHRKLDENIQRLPLEVTYNFERVPVRVYDFDVQENIDQALQIEISENAQRRDYTSEEVLSLYHLLITKGFTDSRGRPKQGQRPVKPMIATIIGQSVRTVKRKLDQSMAEQTATPKQILRAEVLKTVKSITRLNKVLKNLSPQVKAGLCHSIEGQYIIEELYETLSEFIDD